MWFDVETTGVGKTARICQIAMIRMLPDGDVKTWWSLVNPGIPIPAGASAKHSIYDEHVVLKPRFETLAPRLIGAFTDCDFAGYNIKFDIEVITREFKRVGVDTTGIDPDAKRIDGHRLWQLLEPRTLGDAVRRWLGRDMIGAHDASVDISETKLVVEKMLEQAIFEGKSLIEIHEMQWPKDPDAITADGKVKFDGDTAVLTFGKHAFTPLASIPSSYFDYLSRQDFPAETLNVFRDAARGSFPKKV